MRNRIGMIIVLVVTVLLAAGAIYLGIRIQQSQVAPEESKAASEEVWSAEKFHATNLQTYFPGKTLDEGLEEFALGWRNLENASDFSYDKAKAYAIGDGGRFIGDRAIMKVGEETLYGNDLNYFLFVYHYPEYTDAATIAEQVVNDGLDKMIQQSLVLQVAKREGYLASLDSDIFNSPTKDLNKRNGLVNDNLDQVEELLVENVSFEVVGLYYDNYYIDPADQTKFISSRDPSISLEDAKTKSKAIMDDVYGKLENGSITMAEAATLIVDNPEAIKLDAVAFQNSYANVENSPLAENPFGAVEGSDEVYFSELKSLGEGQISKVVESQSNNRYVIIKVNKRQGGLGESIDALLQSERDNTSIEIDIERGQ